MREGNSGDGRHRLAASPFLLASHPGDVVSGEIGAAGAAGVGAALAAFCGQAAVGAYAPVLG